MKGRVNAIRTFKGLVADLRYKTTCCFQKTTAHFIQNDVLFPKKQRLTLHKTTCCFQKNDGSLSTKRRVVFKKRRLTLYKTTCCFQKHTKADAN